MTSGSTRSTERFAHVPNSRRHGGQQRAHRRDSQVSQHRDQERGPRAQPAAARRRAPEQREEHALHGGQSDDVHRQLGEVNGSRRNRVEQQPFPATVLALRRERAVQGQHARKENRQPKQPADHPRLLFGSDIHLQGENHRDDDAQQEHGRPGAAAPPFGTRSLEIIHQSLAVTLVLLVMRHVSGKGDHSNLPERSPGASRTLVFSSFPQSESNTRPTRNSRIRSANCRIASTSCSEKQMVLPRARSCSRKRQSHCGPLRVEPGKRLVQQKNPRVVDQGPRQGQPLTHSLGYLRRACGPDAIAARVPSTGTSTRDRGLANIVHARQTAGSRATSSADTGGSHAPRMPIRRRACALPQAGRPNQRTSPRRGTNDRGQATQKRRLARAVGAADGDALAGCHVETDLLEHEPPAERSWTDRGPESPRSHQSWAASWCWGAMSAGRFDRAVA